MVWPRCGAGRVVGKHITRVGAVRSRCGVLVDSDGAKGLFCRGAGEQGAIGADDPARAAIGACSVVRAVGRQTVGPGAYGGHGAHGSHGGHGSRGAHGPTDVIFGGPLGGPTGGPSAGGPSGQASGPATAQDEPWGGPQ